MELLNVRAWCCPFERTAYIKSEAGFAPTSCIFYWLLEVDVELELLVVVVVPVELVDELLDEATVT